MADPGLATQDHPGDQHGEHHDEGHHGPATVVVDGEEIAVQVLLECRHEPFDGRVHWSGRVLAHPRLTALLDTGGADAEVRTGTHAAWGRLSEPDMWDRYRVTGTGHPPFPMDEPPGPETD